MARPALCSKLHLVGTILLLCSSVAIAQAPRGRGAPNVAIKPTRHTVEGSLEDMRPGMLQVATNEGKWLVRIDPKSQVMVTGTADFDYLRPGLIIRFEAELDNKLRAAHDAELKELTIFTPKAPSDLGIASAQGGFAPEPDEGAKKEKTPPPQSGSAIIGGKITAIKNRQLTVAAGGHKIKINVADDAKIGVEVSSYSIASRGDKVIAEGSYTKQGQLVADRGVTIALQNPLQAPSKRGRAPVAKTGKDEPDEAGAAAEDADDGSKKVADDKPDSAKE